MAASTWDHGSHQARGDRITDTVDAAQSDLEWEAFGSSPSHTHTHERVDAAVPNSGIIDPRAQMPDAGRSPTQHEPTIHRRHSSHMASTPDVETHQKAAAAPPVADFSSVSVEALAAAHTHAHGDVDGPGTGVAAATGKGKRQMSVPDALLRRVYYVGFCFWMLFHAYSAAQLLQTAVNGSSGYACLITLYALFAVAALVAPWVMYYMDARRLLPVSAVPYVVMVAVNMNPAAAALVPACAGVGLGAATLWAAQGVYIGNCATTYARITGEQQSAVTSKMNSAFYGVFASAGGISAIVASIVMTSVGGGSSIRILFFYLTIVGTIAVFLFSRLVTPDEHSLRIMSFDWRHPCARAAPAPAPLAELVAGGTTTSSVALESLPIESNTSAGDSDAGSHAQTMPSPEPPLPSKPSRPRPPSPWRMLRFVLTNQRMRAFLPLLLTSGLGQGCFSGIWMASIVSASIGVQNVGYIGALYSFSSSASTFAIGRLVRVPKFGRTGAYIAAGAIHIAFFVGFALWSSFFVGATASPVPLGVAVTVSVCGSIAFAIGDSIWFSQIPATLQTFFPAGEELACAMASIRCCNALAFAVQAGFSVLLSGSTWALFLINATMLSVSLAMIARLHLRVCSLDGVPRASASS